MGNLRRGITAIVAIATPLLSYDLTGDKCDFEVAVAHLDTQFGWPRDSTYLIYIPNTLHQNFNLFRSNPRYVFSFCGAFRYWIVEQFGRDNPIGQFRRNDWDTLKAYIASGNWALAGSWIDEIDPNIPCAEALCRSFLYGNGYYEEKFGKRSFDLYLPDCFGFGYSLPTIANHFGVRGFSTQKFDLCGGWWAPVPNGQSIMRWQGPDGSFIYAAMKPSSYTSSYEVDTASGDALYARSGMWITYDYYGVGDRGGAPYALTVEELCNIPNEKTSDVNVFPAASDSLFRMLDRLEKKGNPAIDKLFTYDGELLMSVHGTGCYTSHADLKERYRAMELAGLRAEPAAVIAEKLCGAAYPRYQLWRAWFKGIDHAFHDDITGTSMPGAYYDSWDNTMADLDSQVTSFNEIFSRSNRSIAAAMNTQVSTSGGVPVVVCNPLGLDRRDVAQVRLSRASAAPYVKVLSPAGLETPSQIVDGGGADSLTVLFIAQAPAAGYAVYEVLPSLTASTLRTGLTVAADGSSMANEDYAVSIDEHGDISQIADKKAGNRGLFSAPHRWELRDDNSTGFPAWEVLPTDVMAAPSGYVDENVTRTVSESGPVRAAIKVTRTKGRSVFTHYYRLCADSAGRTVVVDNSVTWNSVGYLLKAAFYFSCSNVKATYGLGVGTIDRPKSGTDARREVPAQQWATIGNGSYGVAVMNHYKYGWSKLADNNLCNTLIHSPYPNTGSNYGGDTAMTHTFSYGIYGYDGDWKNGVETQAQRFNAPLVAFQTGPHPAAAGCGKTFSFVRVSSTSNCMIMAIKKAEKGNDYVIRVREIAAASSEESLIFGYNVVSAKSTNGMEDEDGATSLLPGGAGGNEVRYSIGKYQIKTFKVSLGNRLVEQAVSSPPQTMSGRRPTFEVALISGGKRSIVAFHLPEGETVRRVWLADLQGRTVRVLSEGPLRPASRIPLNDFSGSGVYIVTIATDHARYNAPAHILK